MKHQIICNVSVSMIHTWHSSKSYISSLTSRFSHVFFPSKLRRCFVLTLANSARDETVVTNSIESFLFVSPHLCVCWSVRTECFVRLITNSDSFFYLNLNSLPCLYLIMFSVVPPFLLYFPPVYFSQLQR